MTNPSKNNETLENKNKENTLKLDNNKPLISIIIPVYNTSKYLEKCLNSVLKQTYENFEIICINDGSTDNSLNILKKYEKQDKRFNIITQKNQGVGQSRNNATKVAKGEYVLYLDSDDWIDKDTIKKLVINAENNKSDIVLYNSVEKWADKQDNERIYLEYDEKIDYNNYIFNFKNQKQLVLNSYVIVQTKFYRRQFLIDNNLFFNYRIFEDVPQHIESILSAKRISYLPETLYYLRRGERSSLTSKTAQTRESFVIIDITEEIQKILKEKEVYEEFEEEYNNFYLSTMYKQLNMFHSRNKSQFFVLLKQHLSNINLNYSLVLKQKKELIIFYMNISHSKNYKEYVLTEQIFKKEKDIQEQLKKQLKDAWEENDKQKKKYHNETKQLKNKVDKAWKDAETMKTEYESDITELKSELEKAWDENSVQKEEYQKETKELKNKLDKAWNDTITQRKQFSDDIITIKNKLEKAWDDNETQKNKYLAEIDFYKRELKNVEEKNSIQEQNINRLNEENSELKVELNNLFDEKIKLESSFKGRITVLENESYTLKKKIYELENKNNSMNRLVNKLKNDVEFRKKKI